MLDKFTLKLKKTDRVGVLTGAGVSAESGIQTFRDADGLWENHPVEQVATPQGFEADPVLVWRFYRERFKQAATVEPNAGHYAFNEIEEYLGDNFLLVTQNVDGLHKRAGTERVLEMHGTLNTAFCVRCRSVYPMADYAEGDSVPDCPACGGVVRPDIVWFGEMPYELDVIYNFFENIDYLLVCGTSGAVYPAADFLRMAKIRKATTIGINLDKPHNVEFMDYFFQGKSGEMLPKLVTKWI
ncbi:MAG: NAD-dependent deacylase [Candidatus Cloacimonas sp.]|nr:NAD-dependent deacylase [Candidatus Cloacimonadota bacterium]